MLPSEAFKINYSVIQQFILTTVTVDNDLNCFQCVELYCVLLYLFCIVLYVYCGLCCVVCVCSVALCACSVVFLCNVCVCVLWMLAAPR